MTKHEYNQYNTIYLSKIYHTLNDTTKKINIIINVLGLVTGLYLFKRTIKIVNKYDMDRKIAGLINSGIQKIKDNLKFIIPFMTGATLTYHLFKK